MKVTDRQTTDKRRVEHNLFGGEKYNRTKIQNIQSTNRVHKTQ